MTFSRNPKSKYFINDTEYTGYAKTLPGKEFAISGIQYKWVSTGVKASVTEPIPDNPPQPSSTILYMARGLQWKTEFRHYSLVLLGIHSFSTGVLEPWCDGLPTDWQVPMPVMV